MRVFFLILSVFLIGCGVGEKGELTKTVYMENVNGKNVPIKKVYNNNPLNQVNYEEMTITFSIENGKKSYKANTTIANNAVNVSIFPFYTKAFPLIPKYFLSIRDINGVITSPSTRIVGNDYIINLKMSWQSATLFIGETKYTQQRGENEVNINVTPVIKINPEINIRKENNKIVGQILSSQRDGIPKVVEDHEFDGSIYSVKSLNSIDFNNPIEEYLEMQYVDGSSTIAFLNPSNMIQYLETGIFPTEYITSTTNASVSFNESEFIWNNLLIGISITQNSNAFEFSTTVPENGLSLDINGDIADVGQVCIEQATVVCYTTATIIPLLIDDIITVEVSGGNISSTTILKVN